LAVTLLGAGGVIPVNVVEHKHDVSTLSQLILNFEKNNNKCTAAL